MQLAGWMELRDKTAAGVTMVQTWSNFKQYISRVFILFLYNAFTDFNWCLACMTVRSDHCGETSVSSWLRCTIIPREMLKNMFKYIFYPVFSICLGRSYDNAKSKFKFKYNPEFIFIMKSCLYFNYNKCSIIQYFDLHDTFMIEMHDICIR